MSTVSRCCWAIGLANDLWHSWNSSPMVKYNQESMVATCPLRGFKRELTEGGIRVPFIARWPNTVAAGQTCDEVIAFQDMLPTFAELAGAVVWKKVAFRMAGNRARVDLIAYVTLVT